MKTKVIIDSVEYELDVERAKADGTLKMCKGDPIKFRDIKNGDVIKWAHNTEYSEWQKGIYVIVDKNKCANGQAIAIEEVALNMIHETWFTDTCTDLKYAVYDFEKKKFVDNRLDLENLRKRQ